MAQLRIRRRERERQRLAVRARAQRVIGADGLTERDRHRLVGRRGGPRLDHAEALELVA